jgi:hypothetical protein
MRIQEAQNIQILHDGRKKAFVDVRVEKEPVLWQASGPRRQQQRRRPPPPAPGQAGTDPARPRSPHPTIVKIRGCLIDFRSESIMDRYRKAQTERTS